MLQAADAEPVGHLDAGNACRPQHTARFGERLTELSIDDQTSIRIALGSVARMMDGEDLVETSSDKTKKRKR